MSNSDTKDHALCDSIHVKDPEEPESRFVIARDRGVMAEVTELFSEALCYSRTNHGDGC